jgi:putative colanic acid biosynthesis acetyltransferase WcaF
MDESRLAETAPPCRSRVDLASFSNREYRPGRGPAVRTLWYFVSLLLLESGWFPCSRLKVAVLRAFGARIGAGVVVKPQVRIKYPWRLAVGDHCWIGQEVWIDNIADVRIGNHVCISQRAYLCTGSHDHRRPTFDLTAAPIRVDDGAWVCAASLLVAGVTVGANAVAAAGSVVVKDVPPDAIVGGNPARRLGDRSAAFRSEAGD